MPYPVPSPRTTAVASVLPASSVSETWRAPGVVAAVAALLGQPGVEDAVAAVNETSRGAAEALAERLRTELAEVEAVLVSHRRP